MLMRRFFHSKDRGLQRGIGGGLLFTISTLAREAPEDQSDGQNDGCKDPRVRLVHKE